MNKLKILYTKCKDSDSNFLIVLFRAIYHKVVHGKLIFLHQRVSIKGIKNIEIKDKIEVGILYQGFMHKSDRTYLNIKGKLKFEGNFIIGRGCRFDIGKDAVVSIGKDGYVSANTYFIIMHKLTIGDRCAISWDCQFLDDDFHEIEYDGKKETDPSITIGDDVWIGNGVKIFKGSSIPNGCVVAAGSIVRGKFTHENAILAGIPAKLIKENVSWKY